MELLDLPIVRGPLVNAQRVLRSSEAMLVALAAVVGTLAGIATAAQGWLAHSFQRLIYGVTINRLSALGSIQHPWKLLALPLGGLLLVLLTRLFSQRLRPPIDVVEANALHGGRIPLFDNLLISAQTIISNGCGASVGLEATYAQMGGGIASQFGQWLRLRRADLRTLVGAGAGAGVGAAFGAPLTGAFYAFEIVIGAYSTASAAPVIAATLAAALVVRGLTIEPYLIATTIARTITILDYLVFALLGVLCAGLGIVVMRLVTVAERTMQTLPAIARWRPVLGGVLLMPLAMISPQTLSAGHGALHLDLILKPPIAFLAIVLILKISASVISLASGFRGGLFFASLFLGSLVGQMFSEVFNLNPWGMVIDPVDAALVGMAALSVSIVGGPMTLAMLILETTHDFALTGAVLTASLLSALVTREIFGYSFSTWRLHVRGSDIKSPRDIGWIHSLTAERIMRRDWKQVNESATVAAFRAAIPVGSTQKAVITDANGIYRGIVPIAAAWSPTADLTARVDKLAVLTDTTLAPDSDIKTILSHFDTAMADELAVTNANGEVIGIITEKHARRRYLDEIEGAQRQLFGE